MTVTHLGVGIDMLEASRGTGGVLAPGRAYLMVEDVKAYHFLFHFGSVVTIPKEPDPVQVHDISPFDPYVRHAHTKIADTYSLLVDPDSTEKVEFGRATINTSELDKLVLVAALMAQSNTLEHYENVATELTENSASLTDRMSQGKMPPTGRKMLIYIGKSLAMRRELLSHLSVLDPPESIWESNSLDQLYHGLRNNFEIPQRMRVVEHKLELIKETAHIVVSINESRRSHFLELVIIFLIAVEIVLYLIGH